MIKKTRSLQLNIINSGSMVFSDKTKLFFYNLFFWGVTIGCILCGLIPGFISFKRIFYTEDSNIFLVTYMFLMIFFLINIIGFLTISISDKVFLKTKHSFGIVLGYLIIFGLLSVNAALFTDFNITENGYEVPFNFIMYIIDLFVIFPLYGFFDYYVLKNVRKELRRK
ncbi:MAG: hypothetical protein LKE36_00250 [Bacilli bacterium]|nr:hypothetical protein [Bacilli bacterium]